MIYLAYSFIFLSSILLLYSLLVSSQTRIRSPLLIPGQIEEEKKHAGAGLLRKWNSVFHGLYRKPFFQERLKVLGRDLEYAGISDQYSPEEYMSFCTVGGLGGMVLAFFLSFAFSVSEVVEFSLAHGMAIVLFFSFFGFFIPLLKVKERIYARRKAILKALPFTLDLLTVSIEAGMDFSGAIQRIIDKSEMNELVYEFHLFLHETKLGKRKVDSLQRMADRIDIPVLTSIIQSLIQAEELGMKIGQILRIQSGSLRTKRMQKAEKAAMEAPVKMLIPLALFIFPSVFIILLGPMVIRFISG